MSVTFNKILVRPIVTEKSTSQKETLSKVAFEVLKNAKKPAIKVAVEKAFKTKVAEVNTMVVRGKLKKVGRYQGKRSSWKKAVVTLAPGEKIEFFEGV